MTSIDRKTLGLVAELTGGYGRDVYHGVSEAGAEAGVRVLVTNSSFGAQRREVVQRSDALVAMVTHRRLLQQIEAGKVLVNVSSRGIGFGLPSVVVDDTAIGRLAAEHLLGLGCRGFVVNAPPDATWAGRRARAYVARLTEAGVTESRIRRADELGAPAPELCRDLLAPDRPVGFFSVSDLRAVAAIEQCLEAGLRVPEDVAVLGMENDEMFCLASHPTLSSVDSDGARVGYEAASLALRLLQGEPAPENPIYIPPRGVVDRGSTDVIATNDPLVSAAVRYIRAEALHGASVSDVADHVGLARRTLEQRYQSVTGQTPARTLRGLRLTQAQRLLVDTEWSIARISRSCGIEHPQQLARLFQRELGLTPTAYRTQNQRLRG